MLLDGWRAVSAGEFLDVGADMWRAQLMQREIAVLTPRAEIRPQLPNGAFL